MCRRCGTRPVSSRSFGGDSDIRDVQQCGDGLLGFLHSGGSAAWAGVFGERFGLALCGLHGSGVFGSTFRLGLESAGEAGFFFWISGMPS